jgi:hypothetical protein
VKRISKAIAGGLGAALAKVAVSLLTVVMPEMDPELKETIEYIIYTLLTGAAVYVAPANES